MDFRNRTVCFLVCFIFVVLDYRDVHAKLPQEVSEQLDEYWHLYKVTFLRGQVHRSGWREKKVFFYNLVGLGLR